MLKVLGRKQSSTNAEWLEAAAKIESLISPEEVEELAEKAVQRICEASAGKKAAYGYSAGKDSIVLSELCLRAGVTESFLGHCDLEFPSYLSWAFSHLTKGCEIINTHIDLPWLNKHREMLFADYAQGLNRWYSLVQRRAFTEYFERHTPDLIIVGHRIIDGNVCGKDGFIRKKSGETRYSPLAEWPHEAILGYIHYHDLSLPPSYGWEDGYVFGPTPWPIWGHPKSEAEGWKMLWELEHEVVTQAAEYFESARHFLKEVRT